MSEKIEKIEKNQEKNEKKTFLPGKRILLAAVAAMALVLEALPWSAVLTVADKGETRRHYCSCFDPTPFVGRNFGPLFTAVASVVLAVAVLIFFFRGKGLSFLQVVAGAAFVCSLFPLFGGAGSVCVLGVILSAVLLSETVLSFLPLPDARKKAPVKIRQRRKRR